jgi:hypothetical protein
MADNFPSARGWSRFSEAGCVKGRQTFSPSAMEFRAFDSGCGKVFFIGIQTCPQMPHVTSSPGNKTSLPICGKSHLHCGHFSQFVNIFYLSSGDSRRLIRLSPFVKWNCVSCSTTKDTNLKTTPPGFLPAAISISSCQSDLI